MSKPWAGLLTELRVLGRLVWEWPFWLLGVLCVVLYALLLQRPVWLAVDVGASVAEAPPQMNSFDHLVGETFSERVGRPYDEVFLEDVYPPEQGGDFTFRWTLPQGALVYRGLPQGALVLSLRMHGAVTGPATTTQLRVGGWPVATFPVVYPLYHYTFVLDPRLVSGDTLNVELKSTSFLPGGDDPRSLGVALDRTVLFGGGWGWRPVLPATALFLAGTAALLYLGLRRAGLGVVAVSAVTGLWGVVLGVALLLPSRYFLAAYASGLFLALALSYPLLVVTLAAARALFRRGQEQPDARTWTWLGVLFLAAFLLRFGGALSPIYSSHDGAFHANRVLFAERGALFFEHLSIEAGMRSDPYPGALYLAVVPLTVVVGDPNAVLAFFLAWLAAAELFLFWFLARQLLDVRASRWAALLYLAWPIALSAFWFGIYANLFANTVVLLVAVAVVLARQGRLSVSPLPWIPLFALLFLAHFGTIILWVPVTILWGVFLVREGGPLQRGRLRQLLLSWALALLLVVVLYYSYFYQFFGEMVTAVGAVLVPGQESAAGAGLSLARTLAEARVWWRWGVVADYAGLGLPLGLLGLMPEKKWTPRQRVVGRLLLAMGIVAALFWAVSMVTAYFTRYMFFLLPLVALGSARLLALLWQRGRAGRVLAVLILAYICALTLAFWLGLCLWGLHPPHVL